MKAVYVGAGLDTRPIEHFKEIKLFYYIDGQPNSEFGILQSETIMENGLNAYYRPQFISNLDNNMTNIGLTLINVYGNLRIYSNNDQMVYYYTNSAIPEHYEHLKNKIQNFDTLIVKGHDPDSIFLDATSNKIHFIGSQGTCYSNDEFENDNSIIYKMHNCDLKTKFHKFSFLSKCNRINEFDTWDKFHNFYKKKSEEDYSSIFEDKN